MPAQPHEHITEEGTGTCTICYGEGFVRAAQLADEVFSRVEKSVSDLSLEFRLAKTDVDIKLKVLKGERSKGDG